jgi:hypothetical protein
MVEVEVASFHKYVYGKVPPLGAAIASPLDVPKQLILFTSIAAAANTLGWVTVPVAVADIPQLS